MKQLHFKLFLLPPFIWVCLLLIIALGHALSLYMFLIALSFRLFVLIIAIVILIKLFHTKVVKASTTSNSFRNFTTTYFAIWGVIFGLELGTTFIVQSVSNSFSFSLINWHILHAHPINKEGFRDDDFLNNEHRAVFVGDSFTFGFGIKDYTDRFSNLFEKKTDFETWNMGVSGSNTKQELKIVRSIETEVLIFQYLINDIEGSGELNGISFRPTSISPFSQFFMVNSYLINTIGTRFFALESSSIKNEYILFLEGLYGNHKVLSDHIIDLSEVQNIAKKKNIKLVMLVFPYLPDLKISKPFVDTICNFLERECIDYIDVTSLVNNIPINERVVNPFDDHPSVLVNQLIADTLVQLFKNLELTSN